MHLLSHILGLDNATGAWYLFWSGFGSDIGEVTLVIALVHQLRRLHRQRAAQHIEHMETLSTLNVEINK